MFYPILPNYLSSPYIQCKLKTLTHSGQANAVDLAGVL